SARKISAARRVIWAGEAFAVGVRLGDRTCGGEQRMAIVGWLVALILGTVLALFSAQNQQPPTINVMGASYQGIPIWDVRLASAAPPPARRPVASVICQLSASRSWGAAWLGQLDWRRVRLADGRAAAQGC